MIPATTTGVACELPPPGIVKTHFGASRDTLVLSICVMVV